MGDCQGWKLPHRELVLSPDQTIPKTIGLRLSKKGPSKRSLF